MYTYEIAENIGTTGLGFTRGWRWRYQIRNAATGRIVKTGYALTATQADSDANKAIDRFERNGGSILERAERKSRERQSKRRSKR